MGTKSRKRDILKTVALVGTYLPRRCGIATFTASLADAIASVSPDTDCWALALNDQPTGPRYPHRVKFEIRYNRLTDYRLGADFLNMSKVDVVCLQHEYGIFGGPDGQHIVELLGRLRAPVVTTLHTVLDAPTEGERHTLQKVVELSDRLVVMADRALELAQNVYQVPADKLIHIPHGIPDMPLVNPNHNKGQYGLEGKKVMLTFGLLSPSKGIETLIDALPMIVGAHPDVVYVVLGATHPHVQAKWGEDYRMRLQRQAQDKQVAEHVIFHNRFVELAELREFLGAADVYVTPYVSESQIVSGTLAYALGSGNAVVSTPYWYAQEMLAAGRGRLVPFRDPKALASAIIELFDDEAERNAMRKRAYDFTRHMIWPKVARQYLDLFVQTIEQRRHTPRPIIAAERLTNRRDELAGVKLDHLRTLTDDTGVLQHARASIPNRAHGYCVDDNARALIVVLKARDHLPSGSGCNALARRYLSFVDHAFDHHTGRFRNFMGYDRRWLDEVGSEDSHGRAIWALGETVACCEEQGQRGVATALFRQALPAMIEFKYPRAWAYGLVGIHAYLRRLAGDTEVRRMGETLSRRLLEMFRMHARKDWPWPEDLLTYDNARLPYALLLWGQRLSSQSMIDVALTALDWLVQLQTAPRGHFSLIGNDGWYRRGGVKARFDQQPIEATGLIDACLAAAGASGDDKWIDHARRALNWFLGDNDVCVPLFDPITGGCHDGLLPKGTNDNQGAESTLAWLMSALALAEHRLQTSPQDDRADEESSTPPDVPTDQTVVAT